MPKLQRLTHIASLSNITVTSMCTKGSIHRTVLCRLHFLRFSTEKRSRSKHSHTDSVRSKKMLAICFPTKICLHVCVAILGSLEQAAPGDGRQHVSTPNLFHQLFAQDKAKTARTVLSSAPHQINRGQSACNLQLELSNSQAARRPNVRRALAKQLDRSTSCLAANQHVICRGHGTSRGVIPTHRVMCQSDNQVSQKISTFTTQSTHIANSDTSAKSSVGHSWVAS